VVSKLRQLIHEGRHEEAKILASTLKVVAGNLYAVELSEAAAALENAFYKEKLPIMDVLWDELDKSLSSVLQVINSAYDETKRPISIVNGGSGLEV
jgi:HPt (histidine-containing phosphotransfer) domain-containing protein